MYFCLRFANPAQKDYTNWLYKVVNEQWTQWLDDEARATINKGGFYTHRVKDGPRIISLNSMYCYVLNWYNLLSFILFSSSRRYKTCNKMHGNEKI